MSKHSLVPENLNAAFLEQVVGPGKGRVFEMVAESLSIGRSDDNDIVIPSNSVSRNHALVEVRPGGAVVIRDNGSKNGIIVNGKQVEECPLQHGDIVQVGDFAFRYNGGGAAQPEAEPQMEIPLAEPAAMPNVIGFPQASGKIKGPPSKRPLIYGLAALVLIGAFFMQEEETPTGAKQETVTQGKRAEEIGDIAKAPYAENLDPNKAIDPRRGVPGLEDPAKSSAEIALEKMELDNSTLVEAEQYFRRGRREYLAGNMQRAIGFFRTSLTFDRGHKLAQFYLQLSIAEAENEAKKNFELGLKYFDSLQYERANYHFNQAIALMAHRKDHEMLPKAKKYIEVGNTRLRAAELMP